MYSELKQLGKLTPTEYESLLTLFTTVFKKSNNSTASIKQIFDEDFAENKNKVLEQIFVLDSTKRPILIGLNLFEILRPKMNQDHIIVHCVYSQIDHAFRGTIIPYLLFRPAFAIQQMAPDKIVGIFYNAIHVNSYLLAANTIHFPKFQTPKKVELIRNVVHMIYKNSAHFYDDGTMRCYIEENQPVNIADAKAPKNDLIHQYYHHEILDNDNNRGAPFYCEVSADFCQQLDSSLSRLNMNFSREVNPFSYHLKIVLPDLKSPSSIQFTGYRDAKLSFFHNKQKIIPNQNTPVTPLCAKL